MPFTSTNPNQELVVRRFSRGSTSEIRETPHMQRIGIGAVEEIPTVFVVDDDAETREQVCSFANSLGFAAEAYDSATRFLKAIDPSQLGCLVLDARMEGMTGADLQRELTERRIPIPVIVTTGYVETRMIIDTMKAGAFDVVEKPLKRERILDSIRQAVSRHGEVLKAQADSVEVRRRYMHLTPRERQVLDLVVSGLSTRAIASRLGLQEKTIEAYRWRIKSTMEARNAADLVRLVNQISEPT